MGTLLNDRSDHVREAAFLRLSDTMLLFNRTLDPTSLSALAIGPSEELINRLKNYFQIEMRNMDDTSQLSKGEDDGFTEKGNATCIRKTKLIASLGKLIAYTAFTGKIQNYAPDILIHFMTHGKSVEETVKAFLSTIRKSVKYDFEIIFNTLIQKYESVLVDFDKEQQELKDNPPELDDNEDMADKAAVGKLAGNKSIEETQHSIKKTKKDEKKR
jgi:hypothetical protein